MPSTFRWRSTCNRPKASREAGICWVRPLARKPTVQISVPASMRRPSSRTTPPASTEATDAPRRHSTPSSREASRMAGRMPSPRVAPTWVSRSMTMTRTSVSSPRMARRRAGSSVAVSIPVKPPPATTTVLRAADCGWSARAHRCRSRRAACSIWSTSKACSASPGTAGRNNWLPEARMRRS
ncbi:hypothetical protein D9M68_754170 [compost metagenome]